MSLWEEISLSLSLLALIHEKKRVLIRSVSLSLCWLLFHATAWHCLKGTSIPDNIPETQPISTPCSLCLVLRFSVLHAWTLLVVLVLSDQPCWDAFLLLYHVHGNQVWAGGHHPALKDSSSDGDDLMCWMGMKSSESFTSNMVVLMYLSSFAVTWCLNTAVKIGFSSLLMEVW